MQKCDIYKKPLKKTGNIVTYYTFFSSFNLINSYFSIQKESRPNFIFFMIKAIRLKITNILFENNISEDKGGGIYCRLSSATVIDNSTFINNKGKIKTRSDTVYPEREPVQIFYDREVDTLKALRKFMIYSYAATIDKSKPKLKELIEFTYVDNNTFKLKAISKQETDFDDMFHFLEDKNLFAFWQDQNQKNQKDTLFVSYSLQWIPKKDISKYSQRSNVIYLLNNSKTNQLYVGKATIFGKRVNEKSSRVGLKTFDRFLFFELHPEYSFLLDNIENFSIKLLASLFTNLVDIKGLDLDQMTLVNKQIKS